VKTPVNEGNLGGVFIGGLAVIGSVDGLVEIPASLGIDVGIKQPGSSGSQSNEGRGGGVNRGLESVLGDSIVEPTLGDVESESPGSTSTGGSGGGIAEEPNTVLEEAESYESLGS
jgi:hypothetical protein